MTPQVVEYDSFITADGEEYNFHTLGGKNSRYELSDSGSGMPPIDYITQRGPYQHGETLKDWFLRPRVVQLVIRNNQCSRAEIYDAREQLLNILRPNRPGGPIGTLRKRYPNLRTRDLDCAIEQGPRFEPRSARGWDEFSFTETLRFIAFNPIYYDPTVHADSFTLQVHDLIFPITFPILFGASYISGSITYSGNWIEYPMLTVTGPADNFTISNTTTGELIGIVYPLASGQQIVIDLTYGVKSVTGPGGVNLMPYVSANSNLTTFHLEQGVNALVLSGQGFGAATQLSVNWKNRYIGV